MEVLRFIGGLAFFLYGMSVMGKGLTKLSGGRLEGILSRMCRTPVRGVLFGALVTAAIQSSTATTVMVVGFVNAGLMNLNHAVGVIMGANLGTTLTAWILSLSGISDGNFFLSLLSPKTLSPVLVAAGAFLLLFSKRDRPKDLGTIFAGFGILFSGMENMSAAVAPLSENQAFINLLTLFRNPLAGLLAGALLTAILQSSSASVGILQALSATGAISIGMAVPIVMGQNIGTCVTALISAVGAGINAKRAAFLHLYFNLIGTAALLSVFVILQRFGAFPVGEPADEGIIAAIHTVFNVAATALLLPFSSLLVRLCMWTVRGKKEKENEKQHEQIALLDDRFLGSPSFALGLSRAAFYRMCELASDSFLCALSQFEDNQKDRADKIRENGELSYHYNETLGAYLVKLSATRLNRREAWEVSLLLSALPDAARIGDRAQNLAAVSGTLSNSGFYFSAYATDELGVLREAVVDLVNRTMKQIRNSDTDKAKSTEALCGVVEDLCDRMRAHHVQRLKEGICPPEAGNAFSALLCDIESLSSHCKRLIALGVRRRNNAFDPTRSLRALREVDGAFDAAYHRFSTQYHL